MCGSLYTEPTLQSFTNGAESWRWILYEFGFYPEIWFLKVFIKHQSNGSALIITSLIMILICMIILNFFGLKYEM